MPHLRVSLVTSVPSRFLILSALLSLVSACGGGSSTADAGSGDLGTAEPDLAAPPKISVSASEQTVTVPFTLTANGQGSDRVGNFKLDAPSGTVSILGKTHALFITTRTSSASTEGYAGSAVAADSIFQIWFVCSGNAMSYVQTLGTDGKMPVLTEAATGSCSELPTTPASSTVRLPAVTMSYPVLVPGLTLTGDALSYDGQRPGEITLDGQRATLFPYELAASPSTPYAYALAWQSAGARLSLIRLDFATAKPNLVELFHVSSYPDLTFGPASATSMPATWTVP